MIKNTLLGCTLAVALSAAPAMAADFHALAGLQGTTPTTLDDEVLAATEGGGAVCALAFGQISVTANSGIAPGGICFVGILTNPTTGTLAIFALANAFPSFSANFLQVGP